MTTFKQLNIGDIFILQYEYNLAKYLKEHGITDPFLRYICRYTKISNSQYIGRDIYEDFRYKDKRKVLPKIKGTCIEDIEVIRA